MVHEHFFLVPKTWGSRGDYRKWLPLVLKLAPTKLLGENVNPRGSHRQSFSVISRLFKLHVEQTAPPERETSDTWQIAATFRCGPD